MARHAACRPAASSLLISTKVYRPQAAYLSDGFWKKDRIFSALRCKESMDVTRGNLRVCDGLNFSSFEDKLQIINGTIIGRNGVACCLRMTALRPVIVVRSSVQNPATIPCDQRLFQGLSTASSLRAPSGRNRFHCRRTKTVGLRPTVLVRCLMAGMAGRRSGRNGCFGAAAAGVLHGARTIPKVAGRSRRALSRLGTVPAFGHSIPQRSLDECRHPETAHNTVSSYDCTVDDLELVFKA